MQNSVNVGFLGLGNMGNPMAKNLEKASIPLFVYNRNIDKTKDFEQDSTICTSIEELVNNTEIIFTMLSNDDAVSEVYDQILTLDIKGKLFVDMSTISKEGTQKIAKKIKSKEGSFIDAPVAGSTVPAKEATLIFMVGSEEQDFQKIQPYLSLMGKEVKHLGTNGMGIAAKLCINYYLSILFQGMAETIVFAETMGVERQMMMDIINQSAAGSGASKVKTNAIVNNEFPPAFALDLMLKDINLAVTAGANLPLTNTLQNSYQKAHDMGLGDKDVIAILEFAKQFSDEASMN